MLGVEPETKAGCTCGLLQVEMFTLETVTVSTVAAGVATGSVTSGLWAAD